MRNANDEIMANNILHMIQKVKLDDLYPNFDEVCERMDQLDRDNRIRLEMYFILYLLDRGEAGIRSFDTRTYTCSSGANPYEELFYYAIRYDMVSGILLIAHMRDNSGSKKNMFELQVEKMDKSPIQSYLFYELCKTVRFDDVCKASDITDLHMKKVGEPPEFAKQLRAASSPDRKKDRTLIRGHIKIDSSITKVEDRYFYGCKGLTSVEFSKGVKEIGTSSFESCTGLITVALPIELKIIGKSSFAYCKNLRSIAIIEE